MSADRRKRHLKILELISTRGLHTQEELAAALAEAGWEVTQSSVSRDIAALGLVKVAGAYRKPEPAAVRSEDPDERRIADGLIGIDPAAGALLVLHTLPGEASRVGAALDRLAWPEIAGTIAGDDTIFIALRDAPGRRRVLKALERLTRTDW